MKIRMLEVYLNTYSLSVYLQTSNTNKKKKQPNNTIYCMQDSTKKYLFNINFTKSDIMPVRF